MRGQDLRGFVFRSSDGLMDVGLKLFDVFFVVFFLFQGLFFHDFGTILI